MTKIKNIKWRRVFLFFLPPIIFSWPLLSSNTGSFKPYPYRHDIKLSISNTNINVSDLPKEFSIQGVADSIGSKSFLSVVFDKIKTSSMPVEICFSNYNKIFEGDKEIDPRTLIDADEAGAMNFKFNYINSDLSDKIYVRLNERDKCKILPTEGVVLNNGVEIRTPIPLKVKSYIKGEEIKINVEPANLSVRMSLIIGYYQIKWQKSVFFTNLILFILAWWAILKIFSEIWKYIFTSNKE